MNPTIPDSLQSAEPGIADDAFADVPEIMKQARRWLVWRAERHGTGKPRKVPHYADGAKRGGADTETDRARLVTFDQAVMVLKSGAYTGLGFALGPDEAGGYWQGIDLDNVPERPDLGDLVPDLPGYTEMSPSGRGYHAIGYGPHFPALGSNSTGIEAYAAGRFFTVTGEGAGIGEPCDLSAFVASRLAPMHKGMASNAPTATPEAAPAQYVDAAVQRDLRSALTALRADDRDMWIRIGHALKTIGEPGRALWLEWSQTSDKWQPADARQWDTFHPAATSYQAVFAEAQRAGWLNPMSNAARMGGADISGILGSIAAASAAPAAVSSAVGESEPRQRFCLAERTAAKLFVGTPPPVNWLLRGIFPLGVSALLASPPNVGKSFLALDLAAKVARRGGGDIPLVAFGALLAAHGRAVYVSAEDDEPEIHRRLWSLCGSEMPDRLHVLSLPDVGHFGIIEADPTTREYVPTAAWRDLAREVAALPDVKLIVLDTLQALTSGDTNTTQATQPLMNEATALARATGACVLLIHHVAKNKTAEIRTSQDAADAIRGSGAIIGSARAAYVLWPPSDGGRAVCDVLGKEYQEGCAAFGLVAKRYGDARRDMSVFVRDEHGILRDQTQAYRALSGGDGDAVRSGILSAIRKAWEAGVSFAASPSGHNGMHARRFEMPEVFHEKSRAWFEEQVGKLLADESIKRVSHRGGFRLAPADAAQSAPGELEGGEQ